MEYCAGENFEAKCGENEVIVVEKASYGRMRIGKCVKRDFGYLGCQADILYHMDGICSGRRQCTLIKIPDQTLRDTRPCSELESYIHAAHFCQKGIICVKGIMSGHIFRAHFRWTFDVLKMKQLCYTLTSKSCVEMFWCIQIKCLHSVSRVEIWVIFDLFDRNMELYRSLHPTEYVLIHQVV